MQHPGQRNLGRSKAALFGDLFHVIDNIEVRIFVIHLVGKCIRFSPHGIPIICAVAVAGQETACQRAPGDDSNALGLAQWDHFALLFADQGDAKRTVFIEGTIDPYGAIQVTRRESRGALNCPICLAAGTRIDTPDGAIAVEALREGMRVWTVDERGGRIVGHVVATGRTPVPPEHEMVLLGLADGRELEASPGHLDAEGRALGDLSAGDVLDGSRVTAAERLRYMLPFTYDILPSGTTGLYWANGVLLRSTLRD